MQFICQQKMRTSHRGDAVLGEQGYQAPAQPHRVCIGNGRAPLHPVKDSDNPLSPSICTAPLPLVFFAVFTKV